MVTAGPAIRLYAEDHPALAHKLRAKLERRQLELASQVAAGSAQDWPDYNLRIGVIRGMKEAIDLCEAEEKLQNGDR